TLVLESFAFKRGIPTDADYVFDVRMLPNPHYEADLRPLTGCDAPVADFLAKQPKVAEMHRHIRDFLQHWLPELASDHRSYVTVAVGCTGGQHRSVYLVEQLYKDFVLDWNCLKRHREMELARV
ncbi:MAG: RNase adapter RapZ, partial [Brachymonas sp.]|nr:RNase adapter RapZ [Brachymonas sp.]